MAITLTASQLQQELSQDVETPKELNKSYLVGCAEAGDIFCMGKTGDSDLDSEPSTGLESADSGSEGTAFDSGDERDDSSELPFSTDDTFLIFDWDDTVLPTTWLRDRGLLRSDDGIVPDDSEAAQLQQLSMHLMQTFRNAKRFGKVVIVTNGESGWVELSCQKFIPALYQCLEGVSIVSARSTYEPQGIESPFEWKLLAFRKEIGLHCEAFSPDRRKNIVSVGDSPHEREALIRTVEDLGLDRCFAKSLKLVERPCMEQLMQEHELLGECFQEAVGHEGNLDLVIEV